MKFFAFLAGGTVGAGLSSFLVSSFLGDNQFGPNGGGISVLIVAAAACVGFFGGGAVLASLDGDPTR